MPQNRFFTNITFSQNKSCSTTSTTQSVIMRTGICKTISNIVKSTYHYNTVNINRSRVLLVFSNIIFISLPLIRLSVYFVMIVTR